MEGREVVAGGVFGGAADGAAAPVALAYYVFDVTDWGLTPVVLAPILAPVAVHFGIDPVHFGLIMVVNLALGMITPPIRLNCRPEVALLTLHAAGSRG